MILSKIIRRLVIWTKITNLVFLAGS